jgi:hypothetical protein
VTDGRPVRVTVERVAGRVIVDTGSIAEAER